MEDPGPSSVMVLAAAVVASVVRLSIVVLVSVAIAVADFLFVMYPANGEYQDDIAAKGAIKLTLTI